MKTKELFLSGKAILQTCETTIPLVSIASGLYFVSVYLTNGQSVVRKVGSFSIAVEV